MKKAMFLFLVLSLLLGMLNLSVFADRDESIPEKNSCISIEKEVNSTAAEAGDILIYSINVKNVGETKLTGLKIADTFSGDIQRISVQNLPAGVTYAGNGIFEINELNVYSYIDISYSYITDENDIGLSSVEYTEILDAICNSI